MRRYTFYLSIALLAFGIGSFVVFNFYWKGSSKVTTKEMQSEIKLTEQNISDKKSVAKFSCEDEAINTVWKKLKTDKQFNKDAYPVIESRQIKNCQELFDAKAVDLNGDNIDEIILQGNFILFWSSSADSRTWIVSKIGNEYKIIFEAKAEIFPEGIKLLQEKTNNFQNLKIKTNNGWQANKFGFFKFDGKQYRVKKCYKDVNSDYDYDANNEEKLIAVKLNECS